VGEVGEVGGVTTGWYERMGKIMRRGKRGRARGR
jgi:hypothetical protein